MECIVAVMAPLQGPERGTSMASFDPACQPLCVPPADIASDVRPRVLHTTASAPTVPTPCSPHPGAAVMPPAPTSPVKFGNDFMVQQKARMMEVRRM